MRVSKDIITPLLFVMCCYLQGKAAEAIEQSPAVTSSELPSGAATAQQPAAQLQSEQSRGPILTPEEQAARDAEFARLVEEAEAYERKAAPKTREEAEAGVGARRDMRVQLCRAALNARPGDPGNAEILFRIARAYYCNYNSLGGENEDLPAAAAAYEEVLAIADPDVFESLDVAKCGLTYIYKKLGDEERAIALAREIVLKGFPEGVDTPPEDFNFPGLSAQQRKYLLLENAKASAIMVYYELTAVKRLSTPEERLTELDALAKHQLGRAGLRNVLRLKQLEQGIIQNRNLQPTGERDGGEQD